MKSQKTYGIWLVIILSSHLLFSQDVSRKFDLKIIDQPLEVVLDSISDKTGFYFSYNADIVPVGSLYSLNLSNVTINEALQKAFEGSYIMHTFINDQVVLKRRPVEFPFKLDENTYILSGWVTGFQTSKELPGVNVYLDGTTIGGVTNENGYYRIAGIPVGVYDLIFSHIGYIPAKYNLVVNGEGKMVINTQLNYRTTNLKEIEITGNPIDLQLITGYQQTFVKEFFGNSPNAKSCLLLNPDAISYTYDHAKNILHANASEPLLIRNDALGYMITYSLDLFENSTEEVRFYGNVRFENLPQTKNRDKRKWNKNRKRSYQGSLRHFLVSLVKNELRKDGFLMYLVDETSELNQTNMKPIKADEIVTVSSNSLAWYIEFDSFLHVEYVREKENEQYLRHIANSFLGYGNLPENRFLFATREPGNQRSLLALKSGKITVDANGTIMEPRAITTFGYWSYERFSEMVPIDYNPKNEKNE